MNLSTLTPASNVYITVHNKPKSTYTCSFKKEPSSIDSLRINIAHDACVLIRFVQNLDSPLA